jgi:predicted Fe-Mo cluster-binding NifX family protein
MKVAIPTNGNNGMDEAVAEHFGRAATYTIVDTQTNMVRTIPNTSSHMGGTGYPPELLAREGAEALLCRGLGRRAIQMFEELGIKVYIGASGSVNDTVILFHNGALQQATEDTACTQHAFRDQKGHGHGHGHGCGH